mmetsp:Transcript_16814/g.38552  ORF Transcript_16814/g.38552 Transcript_16814/m.38552 type:complete len:263 (-) Transcript_16814:120-908(-)
MCDLRLEKRLRCALGLEQKLVDDLLARQQLVHSRRARLAATAAAAAALLQPRGLRPREDELHAHRAIRLVRRQQRASNLGFRLGLQPLRATERAVLTAKDADQAQQRRWCMQRRVPDQAARRGVPPRHHGGHGRTALDRHALLCGPHRHAHPVAPQVDADGDDLLLRRLGQQRGRSARVVVRRMHQRGLGGRQRQRRLREGGLHQGPAAGSVSKGNGHGRNVCRRRGEARRCCAAAASLLASSPLFLNPLSLAGPVDGLLCP